MNMKAYTVYKVWIWKSILSIKYEYKRVYCIWSKIWNGILSIKYEYESVYCQ